MDPVDHINRFFARVHYGRDDECWPFGANKSYGRVRLGGAKSKSIQAHQYSYWVHYGVSPIGQVVMHACDNPTCVNPYHLRLGTPLDNCRDRAMKGRTRGAFVNGADKRRRIGSAHPLSKLSETDAIAIRSDQRSQKTIAAEYSVSARLIYNIKRGKAWCHVK